MTAISKVWGFRHLKECRDLAGLRDATPLARLPEPERKQWQSLWAEFDALPISRRHRPAGPRQRSGEPTRWTTAIAGFRSAIQLIPEQPKPLRPRRCPESEGQARRGHRRVPRGHPARARLRRRPLRPRQRPEVGRASWTRPSPSTATAIRLKPDHAEAHCDLGNALNRQGKLDEAIAECREAIRLQPNYAEAHSNLGGLLKSRGDDAGALEMYRKWRELAGQTRRWLHPSAQMRSRALDWLKAERDACSKLMDGGDCARAQVVQDLKQWKVDTNLAAVRDPEALARLPEPERKEWQSLWADVDTLIERAQGHPEKTAAAASPMPAKDPEPVQNPTTAAVSALLENCARPETVGSQTS